jgi:hypothetical protein
MFGCTSRGQRLASEARDERRIVREVLGQQLDRDVALEALVEGQLHRRHPADTEAALDPVPPGDRWAVSHPPPPDPPPFPLPEPAPPLLLPLPLPLPLSVVVPPPSPTPPVVVDVLPVPVVEVAVVLVEDVVVVVVVLVVVGVVLLVDVVEDEVVGVVLLVEELVVIGGVERTCSSRQSLAASRAIVLAPWLRSRRSVGSMVAGRVWTARFRARLALTAAPQSPDWTAEEIWSAWPLRAID